MSAIASGVDVLPPTSAGCGVVLLPIVTASDRRVLPLGLPGVGGILLSVEALPAVAVL